MKHIGMDVHSSTTHVTVLNDRGRKILQRQIRTREIDLLDFLQEIPGPKRAALEESQMADCVTRWIEPNLTEVIRCQPQHNRLISESENKCDKQDSFTLAELLFLNKLKSVHHPSWEYRQLREGIRAYWIASRDLTRTKLRLKAFYLYNGIHCIGDEVYSKRSRGRYRKEFKGRPVNLNLLELHYQDVDHCRNKKAAHLRLLRKLSKLFQEEIQRLMTMPGIGFIGAFTLLAYLENGWRISNKRKLWQYCGIGIRKKESGSTGHQRASQKGNRYLKNVLLTAVSSNAARRVASNALIQLWQEGVAAGIPTARLRRNLARKVAVVAHYILRFKETYNDDRIMTTR